MNCEKINCGYIFLKVSGLTLVINIDFQLIQCPVVLFSVVKEYRFWV